MRKINFLSIVFLLMVSLGYAQELITTNGDFETGDTTGWSGNAANVVTENDNSYNSANVTAAGNAWDVNLSYALELTPSETYVLSFDAWSDMDRTIIAGIGLFEDPWSNTTETVTLGTTSQRFTLTLTAPGDVNSNSRVIFDMGADVGFVGIDNVSLMVDDSGTSTDEGPTEAAPTPTEDEANVVSVFSDAYTDLTVNEWGPVWGDSSARINDVTIAGNASKVMELASGQVFAGIDFSGAAFDATEYDYFHIDVWVADPMPTGQVFNIKLSNHDGGAGETSAIQSTPTLIAGSWNSFDIALDDFTDAAGTGVLDRNAIAQIVLTGSRADVTEAVDFYMDNIYFYKEESTSTDDMPMTAAPDPTVEASRVKSVFSGVYDNLTVTEWGPNWGDSSARINEVEIESNPTKVMELESGQVFAGIDFAAAAFNATEYEYFHIDVWVADPMPTGQVFNIKLSNHDGGAGETSAIQYTPTVTAGSWNSFDILLDDFTDAAGNGILDRNAIAQIVLTAARADVTETVDFYLDNIYFWSEDDLAVSDVALASDAVKLYPNPVKAGQDVMFSGEVASVEVYSTTGKQVRLTKGSSLNTSGLAKGVYFVRITTAEGTIQTQKLLVK